jgi:guanylate kinase
MPGSMDTRRGRLIVISAPSGAGKTSIAQAILARNLGMRFSVSATTRPRRVTETEGKDYYFLTKEEFRRRVAAGEFAEWEEIYGEYYGTLRSEIDRAITAGESLVFDIDVKGGLSIKKLYPDALLIFVQPPSVDDLLERLRKRHTENSTTLRRRMERVPMELAMGARFDRKVFNDVLERAIEEVQDIIQHYITHQARRKD